MSQHRARGIPVSVFYDFAESPLWAPFFVEYEDARLSAELEQDLRTWCDSMGRHIDQDLYRVLDLDTEYALEEQGRVLCERLSIELGSDFTVAFEQDHMHRVRFRSEAVATNPLAAAAFHSLAAPQIRRPV